MKLEEIKSSTRGLPEFTCGFEVLRSDSGPDYTKSNHAGTHFIAAGLCGPLCLKPEGF